MNRTLSRPERIAWARRARTPRIGPISFHRLVARYRGAAGALDALPRMTRGTPLNPPSAARIEEELDRLDDIDARWLASCEREYPPLLKHLDAPPPLLSGRGDVRLLARPTIAIVGAREASAAAMMLAEKYAADLGAAGFAIVSGLARSMDGAAHRGSLKTGAIAVLAGGLDKPYPPSIYGCMMRSCSKASSSPKRPSAPGAGAGFSPPQSHRLGHVARGDRY